MKLIDKIKKEYTAWKWIRQAMKEARIKKKEADKERQKNWNSYWREG